jgi:membrane protein implicated in regulation of membrane protease activity
LFALIYLALSNLLGMAALGGDSTGAHVGSHAGGGAHGVDHAPGGLGEHVALDHGPDLVAAGDVAHAHDVEAGHGHGETADGMLHHLFGLFGVGHAPISLIVQVWVLLWGAIGLGVNSMLSRTLEPGLLVAVSAPITFVVATVLTRTLAVLVGRYLPPVQSFAWSREQFVGKLGEVIYPVSPEAGTVHLRDGTGTIHRVRARSSQETLEPGRRIIVLGYDPAQDLYTVDDAVKFAERGD